MQLELDVSVRDQEQRARELVGGRALWYGCTWVRGYLGALVLARQENTGYPKLGSKEKAVGWGPVSAGRREPYPHLRAG